MSLETKLTALAEAVGTDMKNKVGTGDPRLSDARDWNADVVSQSEAEAGTATTARKWTAQRVRQAIIGWWSGSAEKTKLNGIATGATKNATDAQLRDRATHTGTQPISSVTGLQTALDNTTYSEITTAEIDAGTASTLRTISGRRMKYALDKKSDTGHSHVIGDVTGLQAAMDSKANTTTQVIAGNGLTGGGTLAANRTVALGTPSTLTSSTTNAVTATSHTHEIVVTKDDVGLSNVDNTKDVDKKVGSFTIHDTRNVVSVPNNVPAKSGLFEFKSLASVGNPPKPSSGTYAHVMTTNGWSADGSGGWPTQISLGDALSFRKGTGTTTWGPWYELISTATTLGATGQSTLYPMSQKAVTDAINTKVGLTGNQTIAGVKTFSSFPVTPSSAPTSNYQAANKKYVDDKAADSSGIGVGQTWQDVKASRAFNTTYTNTTGKPIMVSISSESTWNTDGTYVDLLVAGVNVAGFGVLDVESISCVTAIVPAGSTYKAIVDSQYVGLYSWAELR